MFTCQLLMSLGPICQWMMFFYHRVPRYRHYEAFSLFCVAIWKEELESIGLVLTWLAKQSCLLADPQMFRNQRGATSPATLESSWFRATICSQWGGAMRVWRWFFGLERREGMSVFTYIHIYIYLCTYVCQCIYTCKYACLYFSIYVHMCILPNIRLVCRCMLHGCWLFGWEALLLSCG